MKHWDNHPAVDKPSRAEAFVNSIGTARFVVIQSLVVTAWITFNLIALAYAFDPFPFILLNLAFSTQAAYATPLIIMAARAEAKRNAQQAIAQHDLAVKIHNHNVQHVECDCE